MKSTDLRIGNWVKEIGSEEFRVGEIDQYGISFILPNCEKVVTSRLMTYSRIKPIPLTEEWLLKFGFEKIYSLDDSYGPYLMDKIGKYEDSEFFEYVVSSEDDSHGGWNYYTKDVKYVHQLQNLFYSLTQTELEINEQVNG